jgi:hypothetical protein
MIMICSKGIFQFILKVHVKHSVYGFFFFLLDIKVKCVLSRDENAGG